MYHLQLRQFPHNLCRFNLTDAQLRAVLDPWARGEWVELGERKWNPNQATLTVIEGPHLEVYELSMGRGWRNAERRGKEVTDQVLALMREVVARSPSAAVPAAEAGADGAGEAPPDRTPQPTSPELMSLLGEDPEGLLQAWRLAARRRPELSPSECLALAEEALRSLGGTTD